VPVGPGYPGKKEGKKLSETERGRDENSEEVARLIRAGVEERVSKIGLG